MQAGRSGWHRARGSCSELRWEQDPGQWLSSTRRKVQLSPRGEVRGTYIFSTPCWCYRRNQRLRLNFADAHWETHISSKNGLIAGAEEHFQGRTPLLQLS